MREIGKEVSWYEGVDSIVSEQITSARLQRERLYEMMDVNVKNYFRQGKELAQIKEAFEDFTNTPEWLEQVYGYSTFSQYRDSPRAIGSEIYGGLDMASSSVNNYIRLHTVFIEELGLDIDTPELEGIPLRKLLKLLPVVKKDNVLEWLHKARNWNSDNLDIELSKYRLTRKPEGESENITDDDSGWNNLALAEKVHRLPGKSVKGLIYTHILQIQEYAKEEKYKEIMNKLLDNLNESAKLA